jgi:glutamine synthetase
MTPEEIPKLVEENNIKIVDLKFNDLPGLWQHFSIPSSELTDIDDPTRGIWVDGIGFDGSSIEGLPASTRVTWWRCLIPIRSSCFLGGRRSITL